MAHGASSSRAKYKVPDTTPTKIVVTERSRQLMKQGLLAPSSIAHILVAKYLFGLPFHRQVAQLAAQEVDHVPLRRAHQGLARAHRRCLRPGSAAASQRQKVLLPILTDFFRWIQACHAQVKDVRSLLTTATGYAIRHEAALLRFLEDGRLKITNNHSERALRTIAVGRKNWLFCGLDDLATSAANLFSLIASSKLHGLDPETYLAEVIHVMPYWPRERNLELAPRYWTTSRARLDPIELAREVGPITVPPPEEQPAPHASLSP